MIVPLALLLFAAAATSRKVHAVGRGTVGSDAFVLRRHDGGVAWSITQGVAVEGVSADVGEALRDLFEVAVPWVAEREGMTFFALAPDGTVRGYASVKYRDTQWAWQAKNPTTMRDYAGASSSRASAVTLSLEAMGVW